MELDGRRYLEIDDAVYYLPQNLHQSSTSEVSASPLGVLIQGFPDSVT